MNDKVNSLLPVDINCIKIVEWLVSRAFVDEKWPLHLRRVRDMIWRARAELPLNLKASLEGHFVDFFRSREIFNQLEADERDGDAGKRLKNIWGKYNSDLLHAWNAILLEYEKNNVHLAESGRRLAQLISVDVPNNRKLMQATDKQIQHSMRKTADTKHTIKVCLAQFDQQCSELCVDSARVHTAVTLHGYDSDVVSRLVSTQIKQSAKGLSRMLRDIERFVLQSPRISEAVELYREFVRCSMKVASTIRNQRKKSACKPDLLCSTICSAREHAKELLEEVEEDTKAIIDGDGDGNGDGDGDGDGDDDAAIDWGISVQDAGVDNADAGGDDETSVQIDWGITLEAASAGDETQNNDSTDNGNDYEQPVLEINWDVDEGDVSTVEEKRVEDSASDADDDGDDSKQVDSILIDSGVRNALLSNVVELNGFLCARKRGLESSALAGTSFVVDALDETPGVVRRQTHDSVRLLQQDIEKLETMLVDPQVQRFALIQSSEKFVERLTVSLLQKLSHVARLEQSLFDTERRIEERKHSVQQTAVQIRKDTEAARHLKRNIEISIGALVGNRRVNLLGAIASL